MVGFEYSKMPHVRRHGPSGYKDYASFKDWLRDEFSFRCVYCLHREQWYNRGATFHVEHFTPSVLEPSRTCDYTNLLYACATCNEAKSDILGLPNPCEVAFYDCLYIQDDGHVDALNLQGERLCEVLQLNSKANVRYRFRWIQTLEWLKTTNLHLYEEFMGFPDDLPDLRRKRVPTNTKPEGIKECYFARRERGDLPAIY